MMKQTRALLIGFGLAAVLAVWAMLPSAAQPVAAPAGPIDVSLIRLIATPEVFDGKLVRVSGFVRIEFEGTAVYLHREDCTQMLTRNGLWLDGVDEAGGEGSKEAKANNRYALLEGQFDAKQHGHMGLWSGSLVKITRMMPLTPRKDEK